MRQIRTGLKSNKLLTLMGLSLAVLYGAPEMIPVSKTVPQSPLAQRQPVDEVKLANLPVIETVTFAVPVPAKRPYNLPYISQPLQNDVSTLLTRWNDNGFNLEAIRNGESVPREFIHQIPVDILDIDVVADRKRVFLSVILPHVLAINEEIKLERSRLSQLMSRQANNIMLDSDDVLWLGKLAEKYDVKDGKLEELKKRVNIVPPSLALAQGVEESGWGTSRFAREGNAIYGQRVWETGAGIIPVGREEGERFEVRIFHHIADSIRSYIHNLNIHFAYDNFRTLREQQQMSGNINGHDLAVTLTSYSERAEHYVETIQNLIRSNQFEHFDNARLVPERFAQLSVVAKN